MGMTEKQGGSDVDANTTEAEDARDGTFRITGHKWFMSAPMSDAFLVLAQRPRGAHLLPGAALPARRRRGTPSTTCGSRTSSAIAPTPPPRPSSTAPPAFLVGELGRGIPTIIDMVTLTRLDCAVASAGLMRIALAEAVHHTRHRTRLRRSPHRPAADDPRPRRHGARRGRRGGARPSASPNPTTAPPTTPARRPSRG